MLLIAVAGLFLSAHARGAPISKHPYGQWLDRKSDLERHFLEIRSDQPALAKWQHYFDVYEHHLARFRGTDVVICEVGINNGGSLALWRSYFGPRARIIGIDLFNASFMQANPLYGSPDRVVYGDQGSAKFWAEFRAGEPRIDVFIDDGGHLPRLQMATLEEMLPHLSAGGVYATEDLVKGVTQGAEGSRASPTVRYAVSNYVLGRDGLSSFFWPPRPQRATKWQQQLFGVSFYPYIIVLEKLTHPRGWLRDAERGGIAKSGVRPKGTLMG